MARFLGKVRLDPPYDHALGGVLSFSRFSDAENTIRCLDELRRRYQAASDEKGLRYCRQLGILARHRAESISRNKRVTAWKRLQKEELAFWFRIWLETPDIFLDWLAMRKNSPAFQALQKMEMDHRST